MKREIEKHYKQFDGYGMEEFASRIENMLEPAMISLIRTGISAAISICDRITELEKKIIKLEAKLNEK